MASPAPSRKPGHHSTTYTLAPPPPLPNWSQTPTPAVMAHQYAYTQPHHQLPHTQQTRRNSNSIPPPAPLGLPETRDFFDPPTSGYTGTGKQGGSGRITPQNDPHRRGMYIPTGSGGHGQRDDAGSEDGEDYGLEDDPWGERDAGMRRSSAVGGIATAVANLGSYVTGRPNSANGQQQRMMSDREIEQEAERAREQSRLEAERILAMEKAQTAGDIERQRMEDEVLRMLGTPNKSSRAGPPVSAPATPATPSKSPRADGNPSWWTAAKQRLTPSSKEKDLTPAQQVIQDTRKLRKKPSGQVGPGSPASPGKGTSWFSPRQQSQEREQSRERGQKGEWPAKGEKKFDDPTFQLLNQNTGSGSPGQAQAQSRMSTDGRFPGSPNTASAPDPHANARSRTQSLPPPRTPMQTNGHVSAPSTPNHHAHYNQLPPTTQPHAHQAAQPEHNGNRSAAPSPAPSAAMSFVSASYSNAHSQGPPRSPYLTHSASGALNVPESLLAMAARLEKLERWSVAHVRALEDRMREVEEYIVGREGTWDDVEQSVGELRKGLEELKAHAPRTAGDPAMDVGKAVGSAWRKETAAGLAGQSIVPATRNSKVERVVSSVKTSDDNLRAMAKAQRAEVAKPAGATTARTATSAMLSAGELEEDRMSLTGLADTLTDYSKMFLSSADDPDTADVSRNTSLARSVGSVDTEGSREPAADGDEGEGGDDSASIASDATEAAHSLHSGGSASASASGTGEQGPHTPPPGTGLPLPAGSPGTAKRAHLPRPIGDYVGFEGTEEGSPVMEKEREREDGVSPAAGTGAGRRRYTAALGAKRAAEAEREKEKEKTKESKAHLPTPDTPGTATFAPSPEKTYKHAPSARPEPRKAHTHTASYTYSVSPAAPLPSPAPSTTSGNSTHGNSTGNGSGNTSAPAKQSEFFTTTRPRPRPHSTYAPLTAQSPAPIKIPSTIARPKQVGLGFVDPLVVRREVRDAGKGEGLGALRRGKGKVEVGQLVKFFDAAQQ